MGKRSKHKHWSSSERKHRSIRPTGVGSLRIEADKYMFRSLTQVYFTYSQPISVRGPLPYLHFVGHCPTTCTYISWAIALLPSRGPLPYYHSFRGPLPYFRCYRGPLPYYYAH